MPSSSLSARQQRFVNEYLIDTNATQAAIRAGYSEATARVQGPRLLRNVAVATELQRRGNKLEAKSDITAERVRQEYARLAFLDPAAFYNEDGSMRAIKDIPEDARRAITGLDVDEIFAGSGAERMFIGNTKKLKFASKTAALDGLARVLGMNQDINVSSTAFQINIVVGQEDSRDGTHDHG